MKLKLTLMVVTSIFTFTYTYACDEVACPSTVQPAHVNAYVGIRSVVNFFEFSQLVRKLVALSPEIFSESPSLIVETLNSIESVLPLKTRKAELIKRFARRDLQEALEKCDQNAEGGLILSSQLRDYVSLLCDSTRIMVESLYKNNKITAEHTNSMEHVYLAIKNKIGQ